jgi:Ca2+-binding RTX toxin-like protein
VERRTARIVVSRKAVALSVVVFAVSASTAVAIQLQGDGGFVGTSGPDEIVMGNGNDTAFGQGGGDQIQAGNGNDSIDADGRCTVPPGPYPNGIPGSASCEHGVIPTDGPGAKIEAGDGSDTVFGGGGSNRIELGSGADTVFGGPHNDHIQTADGGTATIWLGAGANTVALGAVKHGGTSVVHAFIQGDTARDQIQCNGGNSTVFANNQDVVQGCRTVVRGSDPSPHRGLDRTTTAKQGKRGGQRLARAEKRLSVKRTRGGASDR